MNDSPLFNLFIYFATLSLFMIGGGLSAMPEMQRVAVEVMHWTTEKQFNDLFAISQMSPGPNVLIVTMIGYHVAGFTGAAVATAAICGPTCFLAYGVTRVWERFKDAPWRNAVQTGLVPPSLGFIAASAFIMARTADNTVMAGLVTAATAIVAFSTRLNPLWMFAVGGLVGLFGLV